jgi:hypothetical protein
MRTTLTSAAVLLAAAGPFALAAGPVPAAPDRAPTERAALVEYLKTKLMASDAGDHDCFGRSLTIDGDRLIAGAKGDDDQGSNSGAAYVFRREGAGWVQEAKLKAQDANVDDFFGFSVSLSGDLAVIGAWQDDARAEEAGAAYVFRRRGTLWAQEAKLMATDGSPYDQFGYSVAVSNGTLVVGARADDQRGAGAGSAYIFEQRGGSWEQTSKLLPKNSRVEDHFGWAVAINGTRVLIGATGDDGVAQDAGAAYVFERRGSRWVEQAKLAPAQAQAADTFGYSVALRGDTLVVGAYRDDAGGADTGSAYVFQYDGKRWTEAQKLVPRDAIPNQLFGWSVGIDRDAIVVGAWYDTHGSDPESPLGAAYVFRKQGGQWNQSAKLVSAKGNALDLFGWAVAVSGNTVAIGARLDDEAALEAGAVYLLSL